MAAAIGIDLGTTRSCVAVLYNGNIEIISNDEGKRITPSFVAFNDKEKLVGAPAKKQRVTNPENTIFDVKRLIGRSFSDSEVQEDMKHWPFHVIDIKGKPMIRAKYKTEEKMFAPEQISAMILAKMKETAEAFLDTKVKDAVITVPAYFKDSQRQATMDAGKIAGLNVLRIINEPTAAALAYGLQKNLRRSRNVLIYDLGGGTFDVTVMTIADGSKFEVRATSGDSHLGGEEFDRRIVEFIVKGIKKKFGKDVVDRKSKCRLKIAAEEAKLELSSSFSSQIDLVALFDSQDFSIELSRVRFNELCMDLFKKTLEPVKLALADAKMNKDSIDEVVLVGGSTRIPKVQEILTEFFPGKKLNFSINPDEAVAYGAAVQAAILSDQPSKLVKGIVLIDVTPLSLGVETLGGLMNNVIERNSRIPCKNNKYFSTFYNNQKEVEIKVYEGERPLVINNNFLGNFDLCGIPPQPAGKPCIVVTFELDANNILKVSAVETTAGSSEERVIREGKSNLSSEEINKMCLEAESFKAEDMKEFERIVERNSLESFIRNAMNKLHKSEQDLQQSDKNEGQLLCDEALKWLADNPLATKEVHGKKMKVLRVQLEKIITIV